MMREYDAWPSGIRDTTEFPEVSITVDVKLREHLAAFCKMDGIGWNEYDQQAEAGEMDATASRLRTYRKLYERLGLIYKKNDSIAISRLGQQIIGLEGCLNLDKEYEINQIRNTAVDILSRYQLKNPCDEPNLPDTCDVLPSICIWKSMLALDDKLNYEEMNRVILRVMKMDDLDDAIEKIRSAREKFGNYSAIAADILDEELGTPVHTDQASARIAPWYSFAGWGGLLIEQQVDSDGYRHIVEEAIPYIQSAVQNPPEYFDTDDEDEWLAYYIGTASDSILQDWPTETSIVNKNRDANPTLEELGGILADMYGSAETGAKVTSIHIFGIKYGKIIIENSYKAGEIITASGLNKSYSTELQKGINTYKCLANNTFGISFAEGEDEDKSNTDNMFEVADRVKGGRNILLYGVPGAGKSYAIKQMIKDSSKMERVVFHPDYTYSDFVGQILPQLIDVQGSDEKKLTYKFIPGPFTRMLKKALKDPANMYYLVIEEINRGNAPAIFGEIFQLLDRLESGEGEYAISNYDVAKEIYGDKNHFIKMPSNLSIFATMNTADQNVFTLDTAFQRRWDMRQIRNDVDAASHSAQLIEGSKISWGVFADVINEEIIETNEDMISSEDKRLGAYFVKPEELSKDRFPQKALKYLWDDAFKMDRGAVFNDKNSSLEQVLFLYENEKGDPLQMILRAELYQKMLEAVEEKNGEGDKTLDSEDEE